MYLTDTFCAICPPQLELQFLFLLHISAQTHARYFMAAFMAPAALQHRGGVAISNRLGAFYLIRAAKWETLIQRLLLLAAHLRN